MKRTLALLALLLFLAPAPPARAEGKKEEVLRRIETILEEGDLDEAKRMIDFFLGKNPGDPALTLLLDRWRVRKGDLAGLVGAGDDVQALRAAGWRVAAATMKGNPEEWEALLFTGEPERAKALLALAREGGSEEDRRVAAELLARFDSAPPPADVPEDRALLALRSDDPEQAAWGLRRVEEQRIRAGKRDAERLLKESGVPEVRFGAAAALLALGDEAPRRALEAALRGDRPVDAVESGKALLRHPGKGPRPVAALLLRIEADDAIGRAKPVLLGLGVMALAQAGEEGAREFLEARLDRPDLRVDAARALGVLGDRAALPALRDYVATPAPAEEEAGEDGLGFLGRKVGGVRDAAAAEALRPALVGALAILRLTAPGK